MHMHQHIKMLKKDFSYSRCFIRETKVLIIMEGESVPFPSFFSVFTENK